MLSDKILEPSLATDFSSLVVYTRNAAACWNYCSPLGSWRRSKPVAAANGHLVASPRAELPPRPMEDLAHTIQRGKMNFWSVPFNPISIPYLQ